VTLEHLHAGLVAQLDVIPCQNFVSMSTQGAWRSVHRHPGHGRTYYKHSCKEKNSIKDKINFSVTKFHLAAIYTVEEEFRKSSGKDQPWGNPIVRLPDLLYERSRWQAKTERI
jgi:hypothetical protein